MSSLEQYIRNHKSLFDEEPATGHFERLQQKMTGGKDVVSDAARRVSTIRMLRWGISIAASIVLLLSVWQYTSKQNEMLLCENVSDMKICYLEKMEMIASQIETLISDFDPWDQQEVMNDVQNIIEAVNGDFESELPEELPEDMAKAILADYYRQNLEGLERIAYIIRN